MKAVTINGQPKFATYSITKNKLRRCLPRILRHFVFWPLVIVNLVPLGFMFVSSFKGDQEFFVNPNGLPKIWTIEQYVFLFLKRNFLQYFVNSTIVTLLSTLVSLLVSIPAAYAFGRLRFRGSNGMFNVTVALMAIPAVVTVVPLFVLMTKLHQISRYPSAIIIYVGFTIPFSVFVLTDFFRSLPGELLDAARMDGCNDLQIILSIIIPLARAPIVTVSIVNGLWIWNELLIALMFLQSDSTRTLMASLATSVSRDVRNVPLIMAGAFMASIPTLIAIFFGQRYIVRGFMGGAFR